MTRGTLQMDIKLQTLMWGDCLDGSSWVKRETGSESERRWDNGSRDQHEGTMWEVLRQPVTESKLALLAQKANEWEELANQCLKRMPGSFIDQRWGEERNKVKRPLMLQISPSLARWGRCNFFLPTIYRWTQLWTNAFQVTDRGEGFSEASHYI